MTRSYTDRELAAMRCDCVTHRYHLVHLCECGQLISHSQADMDAHRNHDMLNVPSREYQHGDTFSSLFDRAHSLGILDLFHPAFREVYARAAELQDF